MKSLLFSASFQRIFSIFGRTNSTKQPFMEATIKVLIVDDHVLIAQAWTSLLESVSGIDTIGTSDSADGAFRFCMENKPDIVLMDINLKESNGLEATERIINSIPKTQIIGLSLHDDISYVKKFLALGAKGYLTKNTNKEELVVAIRKVFEGEVYIGREIKDKYFTSLLDIHQKTSKKELTMKEIEIVKLIAKGLTSKEIGEAIFISPRTVETHRHNILKKLEIPNAALLSSWAKEKGYI
jgi:DNA-binding NarL/FixJ family response regulator